MATNKAKRSIHLTQPQPQHHEQMPVKARTYAAIAELNSGFEKTILSLKALQQISYFHTERLVSIHDLVCGIRAQANRECLGILGERETANAGHFERVPTSGKANR
jgi:K+-transporting ATPase c subunit